MTVEQLIKRLECYPQEAKVMFGKDEIKQLHGKDRLDGITIVYLVPK